MKDEYPGAFRRGDPLAGLPRPSCAGPGTTVAHGFTASGASGGEATTGTGCMAGTAAGTGAGGGLAGASWIEASIASWCCRWSSGERPIFARLLAHHARELVDVALGDPPFDRVGVDARLRRRGGLLALAGLDQGS